jgi:serine/threonine-protein kinase HipA
MANVCVNRAPVGRLTREDPVNRFAYDEHVPPAQAVSLLMPVTESSYLAERPTVLHPVFDMSLPEGPLREAIVSMFAKALPIFDDLALLEVVGRSLIGRLQFSPTGANLEEVPPHNLRDLLKHRGTGDLFHELLERYARYSGVAGVQPKLLIRDNGSLPSTKLSPIETGARITTQGTTHLVKTFDPVRYPGLAANEFLCLKAARLAGLDVPAAELSDDGRFLVVERFDLKADGHYLAFEDGCAIAGRLSRDKYEGSYEQLAASLTRVLRGPDGTQAELARFFRSLVLSVAVRNGDAHRKNFGVLYDDATGSVWLAPTYDVVTTTAYLPNDTLALMWDGTKRWPEKRTLERFGIQRCQLTLQGARSIIAEVAEAVDAAAKESDSVTQHDPLAAETIDRMRAAWTQGVVSLRS